MHLRDAFCRAVNPLFVIAALLTLASVVSAQPMASPAKQPNVIVILADDLGFSDLGSYGGEIPTPNIDGLARDGVRFTQFYNLARCVPTRAALLTGLYPTQAGLGAMNQDLGKPGYEGRLNDKNVTIAEVLRESGYATAIVGKWHLSNLTISGDGARAKRLLNFEEEAPISADTDSWPNARGFDEQLGTIVGVDSFYDPYSLTHNGKIITPGPGFFYTDFISEHATKLVDRYADEKKPFFLYVAYTAPHWPMHAREEDIQRHLATYRDGWDAIREARLKRMKELGLVPESLELSPLPPNRRRFSEGASVISPWKDAPEKAWQIRRMAVYAAMIEQMDRGIGSILERLRERDLEHDTIVIFLSDNGACAENVQPGWYDIPSKTRAGKPIRVGNDPSIAPGPEESYQSYGPAWANASNTPFRRFKHFTNEGGIATPFIVRWPAGGIGEGGRLEHDQVGHVIDLMPTILDAAGATYPDTYRGRTITPVEGKSLLPALRGKVFSREPLFWEHEGSRAVRVGKWKLLAAEGERWQLYDVVNDRTEMNDLADARPERTEELQALYDAWAKRVGVQPWPIRR